MNEYLFTYSVGHLGPFNKKILANSKESAERKFLGWVEKKIPSSSYQNIEWEQCKVKR